jgi:hypothetical protein
MAAMNMNKARSWNTHALLTRAAVKSAGEARLGEPVEIVGIEDFLSRANSEVVGIIKSYDRAIRLKSGAPIPNVLQEPDVSASASFLRALKLHPSFQLHPVRALTSDEVSPDTPHDPSRRGPPGRMYVPGLLGETMPASEVLATFSDEPDWGMDQNLYPIPEYGYGPAPFGVETGKSSQAPFHMAFLHESPIVTAIVPDLGRSFMEQRIRVYFALARAAFDHRIGYWGWRFTAWAMHYLQDLTQPYHARPFPVPLGPILKRLILSPYPRGLFQKHRNYLKNRHLLFEAAVHFLMNDIAKKSEEHPFLRALEGSGARSEGPLIQVMAGCSRLPAKAAQAVDRATTTLMNHPRLEDLDYSLEDDAAYRIDLEFCKASKERPEALGRFANLVRECLLETGKVTRYAIQAAIAPAAAGDGVLSSSCQK